MIPILLNNDSEKVIGHLGADGIATFSHEHRLTYEQATSIFGVGGFRVLEMERGANPGEMRITKLQVHAFSLATGLKSGDQPKVCDECMHALLKRAELVAATTWAASYCAHHATLAVYLCEKGAVVRMQLNGPVSESEAQAQLDAIVADQHRQYGLANGGTVQ